MKRKLLSVLLTFCLAFSLLPTAALADEEKVAKVGEIEYATLAEAVNAATTENSTVTLLKDAELTETLNINKAITLDGANHKITGTSSPGKTSFIKVETDGDFTMKNATILPTSKVEANAAIDLRVKGKVVVDNCVFGAADDTNQFMYNGLEFSQSEAYPMADGTTISNCTFYGGSFRHNFISFYRMADGATININGNKFLNANWDTTNAIRVSNYSNVSATINLLDNTYNDRGADKNKGYAGLLIFQETSDKHDNFTTLTVNIENLDTTGAQSNQLFYVYKDGAGIISTNQPVVKGDSSIEKFFVAKVDDTSYYETLPEAVAAAQNGETVTLLKDVTTKVTILAGKTVTLDLDGKKLTVPTDVGILVKGKLTVTGNGTVTCDRTPFMVDAGELVIENGTVNSDNDYGIYAKNGGRITVNGGTLTSLYSPLTGNNTTGNMNFTVNGGTLTAKSGPAIYMPGQVSLTITDGVLNGGISLRMGQVNISGGTINAITTSIGMPTDTVNGKPAYAYSGNVWFPDALYVIGGTYTSTDATYGNSLKMNITGGTFNCTNGKGSAVAIYDLGKVAQTANVTISGDAKFATNSAERNAYQVVSFADMGAEPIDGFGKTELVGKVSTTITGGLFSSDPSAYCAEGKTGVASGNSQYPYTVGDKDANAKPAHVDTATVPAKTTSNDDTVKNVASEITGANVTNNAAEAATKDLANKNKLTGGSALENTTVVDKLNGVTGANNTAADVAIVYQTYVDVTVTDAKKNETGVTEITVNLTPMYRVVATTSTVVGNDDEIEVYGDNGVTDPNAVVIQEGKKLNLPEQEYEVKLALPDGFAAAGNKLSIKHTKDNGTVEYYTGTVIQEGGKTYVTFTTKGFSPFVVSAAAASIDGVMYPTLAEAVANVTDGQTIQLEAACAETVTVSRTVKFTLKTNSMNFTGSINPGSRTTLTTSGAETEKEYTFTYSRPSSGGSSSGSATYTITVDKTKNGSVTVSPKSASKGDRVTVTVKPDSGYVLETLTVTDKNGNELTLKDKGNGKYTFTMPAGKVEVKATFMEDNSMLNFFYDVPNNAYFYEAVKWAVENGITTGVGNDLFAPEQPCTRAQIVTFLWRAAGSPEPKGAASGMTDVVSGSYYEKAVAWAIENGITTGTTTSTFSPDATCTRAQAVTFLARALKAKAASAAEFSDVPTGSYFADAVAWAAANGVTEGIGGGLFGSDNDCTRGQIVTFLYRAYNK